MTRFFGQIAIPGLILLAVPACSKPGGDAKDKKDAGRYSQAKEQHAKAVSVVGAYESLLKKSGSMGAEVAAGQARTKIEEGTRDYRTGGQAKRDDANEVGSDLYFALGHVQRSCAINDRDKDRNGVVDDVLLRKTIKNCSEATDGLKFSVERWAKEASADGVANDFPGNLDAWISSSDRKGAEELAKLVR